MKREQVKVGMVVYDKRMDEYRKVKRVNLSGAWEKWVVLETEDTNFVTRAPLKDLRPLTARERGE